MKGYGVPMRRLLPVLAFAYIAAVPNVAGAESHGDVVSVSALAGKAKLPASSRQVIVTYRTKGVSGKLVSVTGTIAMPKGRAPRGGWPVVTWAHGTTGIADQCAPSVAVGQNRYGIGIYPVIKALPRAGFAVVQTDYEGLGTTGDHPYLNGVSEGRSVLDIVRAARKLSPSLSKRVLIAGHSQGGHAALWAAALAPKWTPELVVRGTVALAPASRIGDQAGFVPTLDSTAFSPLSAMILRGAQISKPGLGIESLLTPEALALWPHTVERCAGEIAKPDSFGGLKTNTFLKPGADLTPVIAWLNGNDPETLKIKQPLLVLQGGADTTVLPSFTEATVKDLKANGASLKYSVYPKLDHGTIGSDQAAVAEVQRFIRKRR